jgi:hypothetical protein
MIPQDEVNGSMGLATAQMIGDEADQIFDPEAKATFVLRFCNMLLGKLPTAARAQVLARIAHEQGITMQFVVGEATEQAASAPVKCTCGWQGKEADLRDGKCPRCGE